MKKNKFPANDKNNSVEIEKIKIYEALAQGFNQQTVLTNPFDIPSGKQEFTELLMSTLKPNDSLEMMLMHQMGAVHHMGMYLLARAARDEANKNIQQLPFTTTANKLFNTFARQLEALNHYRDKQNTQKITVAQMNVESGGQAVVGNINTQVKK